MFWRMLPLHKRMNDKCTQKFKNQELPHYQLSIKYYSFPLLFISSLIAMAFI